MDPDEFFGVLHDAVGAPAATLTAGEREFLTRAGVEPEALDPENLRKARLELALLAEQSEAGASEGLTTREVAELLNIQPANVRRLLAARGLYASARAGRGEHVFPMWQFVGNKAVPHLREVLDALPGDMHPLDVESFMTEAREPLGGRSPVDWLATGGQPEPVVALAEEESWL